VNALPRFKITAQNYPARYLGERIVYNLMYLCWAILLPHVVWQKIQAGFAAGLYSGSANASFDVSTGDSFMVRGGVDHQATALEESIVVDVFTPCRHEYL
jgi:hypothetical protein